MRTINLTNIKEFLTKGHERTVKAKKNIAGIIFNKRTEYGDRVSSSPSNNKLS